ncbi:hypothetical protein CYMTET_11611 [Cymbomonas tetramitiformis]|uniref:AB hydrolase-1 domain-containing protein n=1 Tax=Cymbomonas tetramitiformis TaxID=36881 RepID=A0AAE0GLX2_9CHLO|nr:hypothetical protein CYMTET_11611 [Cymbomonas tetramitiformis]
MTCLTSKSLVCLNRKRLSTSQLDRGSGRGGSSSRHTSSRIACVAQAKRGVVLLPGLGNASGDYDTLVQSLSSQGYAVSVASVRRIDWLRNAAGLVDPNYWKGTLSPRPTVDWYLNSITQAVEEAKEASDNGSVCLLAHSAGGWLARVWMLEYGTDDVDKLLTLGSPLLPPPPGVIDQTRGILTYVNDASPGTFHEDVSYVNVIGRYIKGGELLGGDASVAQRIAGLGYQQVCGDATVWGDGIVPGVIGQLEGATVVELEGVYHSPLGATDGADGNAGRPWYGSEGVLEQWVHHIAA